jgi:hypothetical protein
MVGHHQLRWSLQETDRRVRKRGKVHTVQVRKRPRPQNLVGDELFQPCVCKVESTAMSVSLTLPNDPSLHPTPSYSASSLDRPSASSLTNYSGRPKAERRLSFGVLESAKFRLSHDVGVPVPSSLSPFFPLLYLTRVGRTLFFRSLHVSSGHPARPLQSRITQEGLPCDLLLPLKRVRPWGPLTSLLPAPTQSTHGSRALASDYENDPHTALSHSSVDLDHHDMSPLFADPPTSPSRRAKVS